MEKRFQVFISSTFQDLQEERQEVMHALLELDCIPSGMELFPAANETQWDLIKRVIEDCDYYVLIIGGRYGSLGPEGIGFTEMEYDYAVSIGKPTVAFLHKNPSQIESGKSEKSEDGQGKLTYFREKVEKRLCKHWVSPSDLGSVVSRSLIQLIKREPAVGWVRASELADKDATAELLSLRRTVDELKEELAKIRGSAPKGAERLAQGGDVHKVVFTFNGYDGKKGESNTYRSSFLAMWDDIFARISPIMIHEAANTQIRTVLNKFCEERGRIMLADSKKTRDLSMSRFAINDDDLETILVQFRALGLIIKSVKNRSVKDTGAYWTLTPFGDDVMTRLRAVSKDIVEEKDGEDDIFA